nr:MAG TPA: hypothetical protein [Caudoviricetes sp.]
MILLSQQRNKRLYFSSWRYRKSLILEYIVKERTLIRLM